jgi:cytochrome P450
MSERSSKSSSSDLWLWSAAAAAATPVACWWMHRFLTRPKPTLPYPPGPPGHWLWGNALQLPDVAKGEHLDTTLLETSREYGPMFTLKLPIVGHMIVVADVDAAKHILITKNYPKSWFYKSFLVPILGDRSIVTTHGDEWTKQRKAFNPGFSPLFLKDMVTTMTAKMQRFLTCIDQDISQEQDTDMLERSQTFTSDVIVQIAFGEDWGGDKPHPARLWETQLTELVAKAANNPLEHYFNFRSKRKIRKLQRLLDEEMFAILDRRLQSSSSSKKNADICSIAIDQLRGPDDGTLTEDDKITVMHQLKTFYFAGHDTTATTM